MAAMMPFDEVAAAVAGVLEVVKVSSTDASPERILQSQYKCFEV